MTDLPDDIKRAFAELPRERQPDPALEERVLKAVFPRRHGWIWIAAAAAAALFLVLAHPWSSPRATGQTYVLLLSEGPTYVQPAGHLLARRREYGRWADSLARLGKLDLEGSVEGSATIDGLFVIRAANDSDAARIAASCPHNKYGGHIEVRRFVE
jgi:hypothetical protein